MAEISREVALRVALVPTGIRNRLSAGELAARLNYAADLSARAASCDNRVLAGCYQQVAKAALTALPRAEVVQKARDLRAKAGMLGRGAPADSLRRQADDLEAANPQPPQVAVRKAADGPSLTALYDCDGQLFGVAEVEDIVPALDPDVIAKAARSGMVATHDPATGKPTGFIEPEKVTPVSAVTADAVGGAKPSKTGGETPAGDAQAVAKARTPPRRHAVPAEVTKARGADYQRDLAAALLDPRFHKAVLTALPTELPGVVASWKASGGGRVTS